MKRIISALFALWASVALFAQPANTTSTATVMANKDTGVIVAPSLFFSANNVVQTTNSYANPTWLTALAWAKLTGVPSPVLTLSGDASGSATLTTLGSATLNMTLANTAIVAGSYGSATQVGTFTVDSKGRLTAASNVTVTPALASITGLGAGVGTFLATPSSANLAGALTDETGTGAVVFSTSPTLVTPNLGTPSAATLTNATGLPIVNGTTGTLTETRGGTNQTSYAIGDTLYASAANTLSKLGGNTSATMSVLTQTGTGSASAAPAWTSTTGTGNIVRASSPSLTAPSFATIVNTGTLTLPTATDTLVGRATTDTLTNKSISGATNTLTAIPNSALTNSSVTVAGNSVALGGSVSQDQITGLASTGLVKRTAANTLQIATPSTDYAPATTGSSLLYGNGTGGFSNASVGSAGLTFSGGTLSLNSTITQATTFSAPFTVVAGDATTFFTLSRPGVAASYSVNFSNARYNFVTSNGTVVGADTSTDAAVKAVRYGVTHYTNAEEPLMVIEGIAGATSNWISIGGNSGIYNAATDVSFYTAPNTSTLTGTRRGGFNSTGVFDVTNTTASTSTTTGSATFGGGIGVGGAGYFGGEIRSTHATFPAIQSANSGLVGESRAWQFLGTDRAYKFRNLASGSLASATDAAFQFRKHDDTSSMLTIARDGDVSVSSTSASTSTSTGALQVSGGIGVAGAGYFGASTKIDANTNAGMSSQVWNISNGTSAYASFGTWNGTVGADFRTYGSGYTGRANETWLTTNAAYPIVFGTNGLERGRFNSTGNFLLGTTTDNSNGRLQLAIHTTKAGGLGMGSGMSFYTSNPGDWVFSRGVGSQKIHIIDESQPTYDPWIQGAYSDNALALGVGTNVLIRSVGFASPTRVDFPQTTASTSTTSGAVTFGGGIGVAGAAYFGGNITSSQNTNGNALVTVTNSNAGASVSARFVVDNGATTGGMQMPGTGATNANDVLFYVNGANRLRFWTNSTDRGGIDGNGKWTFTPTNYSQASWTTTGALTQFSSATVTNSSTAASGTAATAVFHSFAQPTLAATNTGVTTTDAATVYIAGGPAAGTNQTIMNSWGLLVNGAVKTGNLSINANYPGLNAAAGTDRAFVFQSNGSWRWLLGANTATESGANAGSDFFLGARDDSGNGAGTAILVTRSNRNVSLGSTTDSTSTTTGALQIAGGGSFQKNLYVGSYFSNGANANLGVMGSVIALSAANNVAAGLPTSWSGNYGIGFRSSASSNSIYVGDGTAGTTSFVVRSASADTARLTLDHTNGNVNFTGAITAPGNANVGSITAGSSSVFIANAASMPTNDAGVYLYRSNGSGTGLFAQAGNLVLQPRTSAGTYRSVSVMAADDATGTSVTETLRVESSNTGAGVGGFVKVLGTTASTSTTTGALQVAGGVGVAGAIVAGGNIKQVISGTESVDIGPGSGRPTVSLSSSINANASSYMAFYNTNTGATITGNRSQEIRFSYAAQDGSQAIVANIASNLTATGATNASLAGELNFNILGTAKLAVRSGGVAVQDTTDATSTTTGALQVAGGGSFQKALWVGGEVIQSASTASSTGFKVSNANSAGYSRIELNASGSNFSVGAGGSTASVLASQFYVYDNANGYAPITVSTGAASTGSVGISKTADATTAGAGSLTTAGGIYAAKKVVAIGGVTIGTTGSNLDFQRSSVTPLDFPSITAGSYQDLTYTVTGASPGDEVVITPDAPGFYYPLIVSARVSSGNTVTITAFNPTLGDIDPASSAFRITVRSY